MDDRFNTIAGWVLFAGIVALGSSIVAGEYFHSRAAREDGVSDCRRSGGRRGRRRSRGAADRSLSRDSRSGQGRRRPSTNAWPATTRTRAAQTSSVRTFGACSAKRSDTARASHSPMRWRRRAAPGIGTFSAMADQPEGLCHRNQNDLRRPRANPQDRRQRLSFLHPTAIRRTAAQAFRLRPLPPGRPRTGCDGANKARN